MKFLLISLYNKASKFFAVPQSVKDAPFEDIAESNRRAFLDSSGRDMDLVKADDLDLCVIGSFEDTSGIVTSCKPEVIANIGEWIRDFKLSKEVKDNVQHC